MKKFKGKGRAGEYGDNGRTQCEDKLMRWDIDDKVLWNYFWSVVGCHE